MLLKTRRSQVDRILDPKRDITLSSLQWAALVGRRVAIELVWQRCCSPPFAKNAKDWTGQLSVKLTSKPNAPVHPERRRRIFASTRNPRSTQH